MESVQIRNLVIPWVTNFDLYWLIRNLIFWNEMFKVYTLFVFVVALTVNLSAASKDYRDDDN